MGDKAVRFDDIDEMVKNPFRFNIWETVVRDHAILYFNSQVSVDDIPVNSELIYSLMFGAESEHADVSPSVVSEFIDINSMLSRRGLGGIQMARDLVAAEGTLQHFYLVINVWRYIDEWETMKAFNDRVAEIKEESGTDLPYEIILHFVLPKFIEDFVPEKYREITRDYVSSVLG